MTQFVAQWIDRKLLHIGNQDNFWEIYDRVGNREPDNVVVLGSNSGVRCFQIEKSRYEDKLRVWFYDNTSRVVSRRRIGLFHMEKETHAI